MVLHNVSYNFVNVPTDLMNRLHLPNVAVAGVLATLLLILIFMTPFVLLRQPVIGFLIGIVGFFFSVGMAWVDGWTITILTMFVAAMFSFGFMKAIFR